MADKDGTIKTSFTLEDKVSPVLRNVVKSINLTLRAMQEMDSASSSAFGHAIKNVERLEKEFDSLGANTGMSKVTKKVTDGVTKSIVDTQKLANHARKVGEQSAQALTKSYGNSTKLVSEIGKVGTEFGKAGIKAVKFGEDAGKASSNFGSKGGAATRRVADNIDKAGANVKFTLNPALDEATKRTKKVGDEAENTSGKFGKLGGVLLGINQGLQLFDRAVEKITGITKLSDDVSLTKSRIDLMNDGLQTTAEIQQMIFEAAERSRGSYQDTTDIVSRFGLLAGEAFTSTQEMVYFAEQLNKAFIIGGASAEEQGAALYQLTQALASNRLQGDEFVSIMENAPMIANMIADYLEISKGELKEMSSEGLITADVMKNAVFAAAHDINEQFATMPKTFQNAAQSIKNNALVMFQPILEKMSELANSQVFQSAVMGIITLISYAAETALWGIEKIAAGISWVYGIVNEYFPIIAGVLAAIATYYLMVEGAAIAASVGAAIHAGMTFLATAATSGLTAAQAGLNAVMAANPLLWLPMLIGAAVAAIVYLWRTNINFKYALLGGFDEIMIFGNNMKVVMQNVALGIGMVFQMMATTVVSAIAGMVNGAISLLNGLIKGLNKIPGVNIGEVGRAEFGDKYFEKSAGRLNSMVEQIGQNSLDAEAYSTNRRTNRAAKKAQEIAEAGNKGKVPGAFDQPGMPGMPGIEAIPLKDLDISGAGNPTIKGGRLGSVGKIEDDVTIEEEDIKLLKDIAQAEYINKFTTLRPEMNVVVENVNENADVNGVIDSFAEQLKEVMEVNLST